MTRLTALAPGKVNLCLFVGEPRADGLHPIVSIVQPVSLADELTLEPGADGDEVVCPGVEGENLAARALAAYREASGWDGPPVRLTIDKRVPIAGGMGGGSADAAATLRLAAHAAGRPDDPLLRELAPSLGADVPAQLRARRVLVTGAGEEVEPTADPPPLALAIVPSAARLSTAAVYAEADRLGLPRAPEDLQELWLATREGGEPIVHNDLEPAALSLRPDIGVALEDARRAGADHALVSGSGPTVVALFEGPDRLRRANVAAAVLGERHPGTTTAEPVGPEYAAPREAE